MGKTETTKNHTVIFNKSVKEVKEKYDLKLYKETDRLVLNGKFKKTDKVEIILDNLFSKKTYNLIVSKKPYTAMCIDVFNEEETKNGINVTKYINDEGLHGKYYVYIRINGKVYDFDEYVDFK